VSFISKFLILFVLLGGCSITPMQQAGSNALGEAVCLYEKKIDYGNKDFGRCLESFAR